MSKFKARTTHWDDGVLRIEEKVFEVFEEALEALETILHHGAKIIDEEGRVIHQRGAHHHHHHHTETYA